MSNWCLIRNAYMEYPPQECFRLAMSSERSFGGLDGVRAQPSAYWPKEVILFPVARDGWLLQAKYVAIPINLVVEQW